MVTGTNFDFFVFTIPNTEINENVPEHIDNCQNRMITYIVNGYRAVGKQLLMALNF